MIFLSHTKSEFEEVINNKNYYIIKNDKIIAGFEFITQLILTLTSHGVMFLSYGVDDNRNLKYKKYTLLIT